MSNTFKLMESFSHTIGESYAELTNLVVEPINYIHKGVANKTAWHMPGNIPFFYILELNDTSLEITPENDVREPEKLTMEELSQKEFYNQINLKFLFTEQQFTFTYFGWDDFFADLGGVSKIAEEALGSLAFLLIWIYFIDLAMMLRRKHKIENKNNKVVNLSQRLPIYLKSAKAIQNDQTPLGEERDVNKDIHLIQCLINEWDDFSDQLKDKDVKREKEDAKEEYTIDNHLEELEELDKVYYEKGQKFIDTSNIELFDTYLINESTFTSRLDQTIRDFFIDIKKTISFVGIYMINDDVEDLDRQLMKYKKTMQTAFKMLFKHQDNILDQQLKRQKKKTMGKVQLLNPVELINWNESEQDGKKKPNRKKK